MKGQHPKRISELLEHPSIIMALDGYSHVIPSWGSDDVIMEDALS